MKRTLSVIFALVLVLSMSAIAFADTTPTAEIPADTMQAFIDDTPEGYYLAGTNVVPINDDFTAYEAIYKPLVQPRYSTVTDTKGVYVWCDLVDDYVIYSQLTGTFRYDGYTSTCTKVTANTYLLYSSHSGYTFNIANQTVGYNGDQGYVDLIYDIYLNGYHMYRISNYKPTIACDPYGNVY